MNPDFWQEVERVAWPAVPRASDAVPGPSNSVPDALHRLDAARTEAETRASYHFTLDAVGHDHSGHLCVVLNEALPFLLRLATEAEPFTRRAACEVLIDVLSWLPSQTPAFDDKRIRSYLSQYRSALRQTANQPDPALVADSQRELADVVETTLREPS
ncbi:hypothetical protein [Cryptosporangium japonicum]|uniref:Uncharacterized protein n=1 Tax=Cryptosporangium japonicum TaxID=80872 RepID=A0ABP3D726_9ACTN